MYVDAEAQSILKFQVYRNNEERIVLKFRENGLGQDHPPLPYNWPGAQYEFPGDTAPPEPIQPKRGPVLMPPAKKEPPPPPENASAGPPTKPQPRALPSAVAAAQALAKGRPQKAAPELPEHVGLIYRANPEPTATPEFVLPPRTLPYNYSIPDTPARGRSPGSHLSNPQEPIVGKPPPPPLPLIFPSDHPNGPVARPKPLNAHPPPPEEEPPQDSPQPAVAAGVVPIPPPPAVLCGPSLTHSQLVARCREIPEDLTRAELGARAAEILQEVGAPPKAPPAHLVGRTPVIQPLDFSLHDAAAAESSAAGADQLYVPGRTVPCKECGQHLVPAR